MAPDAEKRSKNRGRGKGEAKGFANGGRCFPSSSEFSAFPYFLQDRNANGVQLRLLFLNKRKSLIYAEESRMGAKLPWLTSRFGPHFPRFENERCIKHYRCSVRGIRSLIEKLSSFLPLATPRLPHAFRGRRRSVYEKWPWKMNQALNFHPWLPSRVPLLLLDSFFSIIGTLNLLLLLKEKRRKIIKGINRKSNQ